jgi:hypothetical protein
MIVSSSLTRIRGIVQVVPIADRHTWGILRGRQSTKSLWIVPELWKNAQNAFSHKLVGRAHHARPHAPQAYRFLFFRLMNEIAKITGLTTQRRD